MPKLEIYLNKYDDEKALISRQKIVLENHIGKFEDEKYFG